MICGSGGSKSRLAKAARVRSQLARWEIKSCTPLWHEAHLQVEKLKTPHVTFGALLEVEMSKSARRCGAKHICKSKCAKHTMFGPLFEVEMSKSARRCGAKHISKSKCTKHTILGALFEVDMSKKCGSLWPEAHFQVKMLKPPHVRTTFGRSDVVLCGRRKGLCTLSKVSKTWGFCSSLDNNHHYTTLH